MTATTANTTIIRPLPGGASVILNPCEIERAKGATEGLIQAAADYVKRGERPPQPQGLDELRARLDEAAKAQGKADEARDTLEAAIAAVRESQDALRASMQDLAPELSEEAAIKKIRVCRERADRAELQERRARAILEHLDSQALRLVSELVRRAATAAQAITLALAVDEMEELLGRLHPRFVDHRPADSRRLVAPAVAHAAAVCEFGTLEQTCSSHGATLFAADSERVRAALRDAAKVVARICPLEAA
jgi:hypothetical protein